MRAYRVRSTFVNMLFHVQVGRGAASFDQSARLLRPISLRPLHLVKIRVLGKLLLRALGKLQETVLVNLARVIGIAAEYFLVILLVLPELVQVGVLVQAFDFGAVGVEPVV